MSDFDEEAERERLREKYEHDEQKREVTERMSELLLKGATMTNAHCSDCGDPIFRYDGQEFCATCQKAVQRDTGEADDESAAADAEADGESGAESDDGATNGDRDEIHVAAPDETRVQFGGDEQPVDEAASEEPTPADESANASQDDDPAPAQPAPTTQPSQSQSVDPGDYGDLAAAAAALSREVNRLARQAEATDDLGQKRALLEATEEAADALDSVQDAAR